MDHEALVTAAKGALQEWKEFYKDAGSGNGVHGHVALAFDDERGHYVFLEWGWDAPSYDHSALIHLEVRDNCIFVHWDGTEQGVWDDLRRAGVPESQIILAWQDTTQHPATSQPTTSQAARAA